MRIRIDKVELAAGQVRGAREVVRVEAVLLEAPRANGGARRGRVDVEPRAVDGDALQALAKVWVGRVRAGHEAADDICVDLVEEETRVQRGIVELEGASAVEGRGEVGGEYTLTVKGRMRDVLLRHWVIAIDWWRVRKVNYDGVLRGVLSRVATIESGAHVDTSREELRRATRYRRECLMGRLEQVGDSLRRQKHRTATRE